MHSRTRSIIYWAIWGIVVGTVLAFICLTASAATRKRVAVTQGAGASALLKGIKKASPPPVPKAVVIPRRWFTNWFSATAVDENGLESDYSTEVAGASTKANALWTLAWDPSPGTNVIKEYRVYQGPRSRTYTNVVSAGTNCTVGVFVGKRLPTNLVITVTGPNLNISLTNPTGSHYWTGRNLTISTRRF